jgi:hypothetical protein
MSAEVIGRKVDAVPSVTSAFTVAAARTMKACIRKAAGTKWSLLLTIAVGALLTVVAMKLMALLGAAFDISFLRDVGSNGSPWAPLGGFFAGLGAFFKGDPHSGGHPGFPAPVPLQYGPPAPAPLGPPNPYWPPQYGPPSPFPSPWKGPFAGPPNPDGSRPGMVRPDDGGTSAGFLIWFSQGVQKAATAIIGADGTGSSGNACGKA